LQQRHHRRIQLRGKRASLVRLGRRHLQRLQWSRAERIDQSRIDRPGTVQLHLHFDTARVISELRRQCLHIGLRVSALADRQVQHQHPPIAQAQPKPVGWAGGQAQINAGQHQVVKQRGQCRHRANDSRRMRRSDAIELVTGDACWIWLERQFHCHIFCKGTYKVSGFCQPPVSPCQQRRTPTAGIGQRVKAVN